MVGAALEKKEKTNKKEVMSFHPYQPLPPPPPPKIYIEKRVNKKEIVGEWIRGSNSCT